MLSRILFVSWWCWGSRLKNVDHHIIANLFDLTLYWSSLLYLIDFVRIYSTENFQDLLKLRWWYISAYVQVRFSTSWIVATCCHIWRRFRSYEKLYICQWKWIRIALSDIFTIALVHVLISCLYEFLNNLIIFALILVKFP